MKRMNMKHIFVFLLILCFTAIIILDASFYMPAEDRLHLYLAILSFLSSENFANLLQII